MEAGKVPASLAQKIKAAPILAKVVTMKKPKPKFTAPDHLAAAHAELVRAEALLDCLVYCLNYADSDEQIEMDFHTVAELARAQVASAVDKLDAAQSSLP
jgi:hypothetical protein